MTWHVACVGDRPEIHGVRAIVLNPGGPGQYAWKKSSECGSRSDKRFDMHSEVKVVSTRLRWDWFSRKRGYKYIEKVTPDGFN